jgi:hypothetical protein
MAVVGRWDANPLATDIDSAHPDTQRVVAVVVVVGLIRLFFLLLLLHFWALNH